MNGLIKAGAAHLVVRPFAAGRDRASFGSAAAAPAAADERIEALRRENGELAEALFEARAAAARGEAEAREQGRLEGRESASLDEAERLDALKKGLDAALGAWEGRLERLDGLAAALTRSALSRLFEDSAQHAELLTRSIDHRLRQLRRQAAVAVSVSREDFPDDAALEALAAGISKGSASLAAVADLPAGECRVDLQCGHIDLGRRSQWEPLLELLGRFAEEAAG